MYLVGIISENKEIIRSLEKEFNNQKVDFIDLDINIIENFKNIRFDIILIADLKNYNRNNNFKKIVSNAYISVINTDIKDNLNVLDNLNGMVITYGFNPKATVTVSSVSDDNMSICIQRVIGDMRGKKIEPIEYVENIQNCRSIEMSDIIGIKFLEKILAKKKN